jgi:hypothetical protein
MKPEWSTIQNNWEGSEPGFVQPDHTKLDFRLVSDAIVHGEIGFQQKAPEPVGLYPSPQRRTWPVALDLPPADWKPRWMRREGRPSNAVLHILSLKKTENMLEPTGGCEVCEWAKPKGHRLSANLRGLPTDSWQELSFSFVSKVDGDVSLILLGDGYTDPFTKTQLPVWVYMDDLRVEGAELVNGDFEERLANGKPAGWRPHVKPAISIQDPDLAASGSWLVKVAHDRRFSQTLRLTAGQAVTVRAKVRGLPVQRAE